MSAATASPIRAETGASVAHGGHFLPTGDAAEPCLASGGVAPLPVRGGAPGCVERNKEIVRLLRDGATQTSVAARFGISRRRVEQIGRQITAEERMAVQQRKTRARQEARSEQYFVEYAAGFTQDEIAHRHGITRGLVASYLLMHPDYTSRRRVFSRQAVVPIPTWVPKQHVTRYRHIASGNGEEIAAGCLRRLLRWEAERP